MITSVDVSNYRGIESLTLDKLGPLTILTGENNAGKSSVLESIFLLLDFQSPEVFLKLNRFRGKTSLYGPEDLWGYLFNQSAESPMVIRACISGEDVELRLEKNTTSLTYKNSLHSPFGPSAVSGQKLNFTFSSLSGSEEGAYLVFPDELRRDVTKSIGDRTPDQSVLFIPAARSGKEALAIPLGQIELMRRKDDLIRTLQIMDDKVADLTTISRPDGAEVFVSRSDGTILPLLMSGDGLTNFAMLSIYTLANPGALVLIDEIENGLHHSLYGRAWEGISRLAQENEVQILASTHSYEFLAEAIGAAEGGRARLPELYRLENKAGKVRTVFYPSDVLDNTIGYNLEVR